VPAKEGKAGQITGKGHRLAPARRLVATLADELGLAPAQGNPPRSIVVKADGNPLDGGVAGFAVGAIVPGVFVLPAVAGAAAGGQTLIALAGLALAAGDPLARVQERKPGLAVIEGVHAPPRLLAVTAFAFFAQPAFVGPIDLWQSTRRPGVSRYFVFFTWQRPQLGAFVRPCQGEIGKSVVESFAVELNDAECAPIVLGVAALALALDRIGWRPWSFRFACRSAAIGR
jgi:hypothetical protein